LLEYFSVWYEESKNKAVIITELLQGGNLREHRKYQKKLKIKLIKKWIKQILLALDYLHSNGFIHHDIKCQNILVNRLTGNLKLGDLIGLEKVSDKGYFTKYVGTEEFMAPEAKEGKYTFKADIYSLGLTIIQFLTMEKPYKEFTRKNNLYEAKKNGKLPLSFNQINNKEIQDFILLCLKPENERPTCKELLDNAWLNDKSQQKNNVYVDIINNLRQPSFLYDKKDVCYSGNLVNKEQYQNNLLTPFTSSNSLFIPKKNKQISMGPIYSLDISKLSKINSLKNEKDNKEMNSFRNKYKLNSLRLKPKKCNQLKGLNQVFFLLI
jgi:serine/threonine protein kinase